MKMLKKLLAVVLTGAMALTLLTACGGNAVTEKDLADALNDMAKAEAQANGQDTYITFTPRAEEREMARKLAALLEGKATDRGSEGAIKEILGYDNGGANAKNFVWWGAVLADKIGTSGQAFQIVQHLLNTDGDNDLENREPKDNRHMGTALCKMREGDDEDSKLVTVRIIVVTAEPAVEPAG